MIDNFTNDMQQDMDQNINQDEIGDSAGETEVILDVSSWLRSVATALVTPFDDKSQIDWNKFDEFLRWQIESGIRNLVPCGTTGESPTLSHEEHNDIILKTIEVAKSYQDKSVRVIAGTGSNSTQEAISTTIFAQEKGADAVLIVMPYYNKPSQMGIYQHYKTIHDNTNIPIVLYDIPGRSVIQPSVDIIAKLFQLPRIVAIKDATGNLEKSMQIHYVTQRKIIQLCGDDSINLAHFTCGGVGSISVLSNLMPKKSVELYQALFDNNLEKAMEINKELYPLVNALTCQVNPTPIKYAMSLIDKCDNHFRLPLCSINDEDKKTIKLEMQKLQLI